jgi:hypothetical protein
MGGAQRLQTVSLPCQRPSFANGSARNRRSKSACWAHEVYMEEKCRAAPSVLYYDGAISVMRWKETGSLSKAYRKFKFLASARKCKKKKK